MADYSVVGGEGVGPKLDVTRGCDSGDRRGARMARGDPDPQCRRADGELQWGNQLDRLAIDAGMHSRWGLDL